MQAVTEPVLYVYSRPGCHLCDDLLNGLATLPAMESVRVEVVDISGDLALERDYGTRIPVVELAGRELCRYRLDTEAVCQALASL